MPTLATGLSSQNRANTATCQGLTYWTNGFDPVQVWDGLYASLREAGIAGPALAIGAPTTSGSAGFDNGDHLIRYRWKNSKTGFVGNPSPPLLYTVTGNESLVFSIGVADDIRTTTDTKVDLYVVEATRVGGGSYYQVGTAAVGATTITVGMDDDALSQQFDTSARYGGDNTSDTYSSQKPPLGAVLVAYRGRLWVLGDNTYDLTAVTFTNNSAAIVGTGFSTAWDDGEPYLLLCAGDTTAYEIITVTNSTNMTLAGNWTGSTGSYAAKVFKQFPNNGYYSKLFLPEQFFPDAQARSFLDGQSDAVRAGVGLPDGLYVMGLFSTERLIFNSDPSATAGATLSLVKGRRGCWNQRCVVEFDGVGYGWDRQGMWIIGATPRDISLRIRNLIRNLADFTEEHQFHAAPDPESRSIIFFYVQSGDTVPKSAAAYEVDTGRWTLLSFQQGITASQVVPTDDGEVRLMLGDENGFTWYYGIPGAFDGPPPDSPTVVIVTGTPTTTVIPVAETLPTTAPGLNGVMVYDPLTGESRYTASNTASVITVGTAFSTAPTVGQELYLGAISFEWQSKWLIGNSQAKLKNPTYCILSLFPGSATGTARVYFYADFSTSPSQFTAGSADTFPEGVTIGNNNYYAEINLDGGDTDGVLYIPIPIEWKNALQIRVTSIRPDGEMRILNAQLASKRGKEISDAD